MASCCFSIRQIRQSITILTQTSNPPGSYSELHYAEQSYVEGLAFDKKSKERDAREAYIEALRRVRFCPGAHRVRSVLYKAVSTRRPQII